MAAKQEPANYGSGGSTTSSEVEGGVVLGLDGARQGKHADAGKPTREGFYLTIGTVIDFRLWPLPIDLLMLFYMLSVYMQGAAGNELVQELSCHDLREANVTNSTNPDFCKSPQVQAYASNWLFWFNLAMVLPSLVVVMILGSVSDTYGRKPMMALPCIGGILQQAFIIMVMDMELPTSYLLICMIVRGLCGTFALFMAALFSSVIDESTPESKTRRISILEGLNLVGTCVGQAAGGKITEEFGYRAVFLVVMGMYGFTLLYVFLIREPLPKERRSKKKITWQEMNIFRTLWVLVQTMDLRLLSLSFLSLMTIRTGFNQAIIYYLMSPVFNWGKDKVGYYGAVSSASNGVGLCLLIPAFTLFGQYVKRQREKQLSLERATHHKPSLARRGCLRVGLFMADDYPLCQMSLLAGVAQFILWAITRDSNAMFFITSLGILSGVAMALFRSMMTKLVAEDQIGKMQAALGAIEEVCNITGPLVFLKTYEGTVGSFPQAFLLVAAGLSGLSSVLVLLVNVYDRLCGSSAVVMYEKLDEADDGNKRPLLSAKGAINTEEIYE